MAGLGSVEPRGVYLSVAGGFIWNRKAGEDDPDYATQEYTKADKSVAERSGARYKDITGLVTDVRFRTHDEYGESINVVFDVNGEEYILSTSTNNRNSQDLMKFLLKGDLKKEVYLKPYDFIGDNGKRTQGISFRQDGKKVELRNDDSPSREKEWFKTASKRDIKRFFEDVNDWFVAEVEENIIPLFASKVKAPKKVEKKEGSLGAEKNPPAEEKEAVEEKKTEVSEVAADLPSPIKMKKALRAYIEENYEGETLPKLNKEDLVVWYNLSLEEEELPFEEDEASDAEVPAEDLDGQLDALMNQ